MMTLEFTPTKQTDYLSKQFLNKQTPIKAAHIKIKN